MHISIRKYPSFLCFKSVIQRIWDFNNNKTAGAPDQRPTHTDTPENAWDHSKLPTSQAVAEAIQAVQWNHEDFVEALRQRGAYPRAFTTEVGTGDKYNPDLPVTLSHRSSISTRITVCIVIIIYETIIHNS